MWSPITVPAQTSAALSVAEPASTRNPIPRPVAAWLVIRASCPAPTMPTTGAGGGMSASSVTRVAYEAAALPAPGRLARSVMNRPLR